MGRRADPRARFARSLAALTGLPQAPGRLGLAVSGGPDSLGLLILAHDLLPGRIAAATVDHGLRPEARDEAALVADIAAARGIPHQILTPDRPITGSLQAAARAVRYRLLDHWREEERLIAVATAHHADDQVETIAMRLLRGSGTAGLAAIRPRNGSVVRPVLDLSRAELAAIVAAAGLIPVDDPSNHDARFDRAWLRARLAMLPIDPVRVARSATAIAEAEAALDFAVTTWLSDRITATNGGIAIAASGLPRDLQRRLLRRGIAGVAPDANPRGEAIERALDALLTGDAAQWGDLHIAPGTVWRVTRRPARRTG